MVRALQCPHSAYTLTPALSQRERERTGAGLLLANGRLHLGCDVIGRDAKVFI
jgi:hypothetical protein